MYKIPVFNEKFEKKLISRLFFLIITIIFSINLFLVFRININWDEFYFLARIYSFKAGTLDNLFQSFHVYIFYFLTFIGENEIHQILIARIIMLVLNISTIILIYKISKVFFSKTVSYLVVLNIASLYSFLRYGPGFRADGVILFLVTLSLYFLVKHEKKIYMVLAGLIAGLSFVITMKFIFHLGGLVICMGLYYFYYNRKYKNQIIIFLISSCLTVIFIILLHFIAIHNAVPFHIDMDSKGVLKNLHHTFDKVILTSKFFPRIFFFKRAMITDFLFVLFSFLGTCIYLINIKENIRSNNKIIFIMSTFFPVLSILFYRNAFPYYYCLIFPLFGLFSGYFFRLILNVINKLGYKKGYRLFYVFFVIAFALTIFYFNLEKRDELSYQKQVVETVHKMYPEPVVYIDRCSMIPSFPKVGFFMSTWGLENYRERKIPLLKKLIRKYEPKLLIANSPGLINTKKNNLIFKEDKEVLFSSYVKYWGPLYVPGKKFEVLNGNEEIIFTNFIPGNYLLTSNNKVAVNGVEIFPNGKFYLKKGRNVIASKRDIKNVTFCWNELKYNPSKIKPKSEQIFTGL